MGQRALRLQARVLGKEKLHPSDLMAPPPQGPDAAAALAVPFDQSMTLIQDAVSSVHPSVGDFVKMMGDKQWIEVPFSSFLRAWSLS